MTDDDVPITEQQFLLHKSCYFLFRGGSMVISLEELLTASVINGPKCASCHL